ncbi:unnamed protein product [Mytilus edulis]|uniref:Uncharacterized protein n=1 Tax=Mytilus edulis TaxID=6550 RepID=A0A8S3QFN0_MYTED|nr:unnamed protein product [Mytilus edulis]
MSVVQARIHDKYKYNFEKVLEYLLKGLEHLSVFIQHLNEITGGKCQDDDKYIAKVNNDKLKEIDSDLNKLEKELQGTNKAVDNANDQCRRKGEDLTAAENALSDARRKLDDAKTTQEATIAAGVSTTLVSAFLTIFVPPVGIVGMAAGVGTGIVGITALEEAVSLCSNNCSSARSEVQSSESALERAKKLKLK